MTQLTLSKSNYLKESEKLDSYQRYLPSLDLKRKQLLSERGKEQDRLRELEMELSQLIESAQNKLPMLSSYHFSLERLVKVEGYTTSEDNLMGIHLPKLDHVEIKVVDYGLLTKPMWLDYLCRQLALACELSVRCIIQRERMAVLSLAARKATQRVNLVSEVLIPEARVNIRKIKIFLDDNERASVVRSKLAKKKKHKTVRVDATQDGEHHAN